MGKRSKALAQNECGVAAGCPLLLGCCAFGDKGGAGQFFLSGSIRVVHTAQER